MLRLQAKLGFIVVGVLIPVMTAGCTASRSVSPTQNAVQSPFGGASGGTSLFSFKPAQSGGAVAASYSEPVQTADPTSLSTEAKPSPRLYVAMAKLHEKSNQFEKAEEQYRRALQMDAKYLDALLGLGRLKDREGDYKEALETYQRAVKYHPENAAAWNHLGLCLARQGKLSEAADALQKAVNLDPRHELYRTNLAVIFVEAGRTEEALQQLRAVQDEAQAYYNLGYLLQKRGDTTAAARYFNLALQRKPDFEEARQWLETLRTRNDNSLIAEEPRMGRPKQRVSLTQQLAEPGSAEKDASVPSQTDSDNNDGRRASPFRLPFFSPQSKGTSAPTFGNDGTASTDRTPDPGTPPLSSWSPPGGRGSRSEFDAGTEMSRSAPPKLVPTSSQPSPKTGKEVTIQSPKSGSVVAPLPPVLAEPVAEVQPLPPIAP
ncbi:MAG: hypothetical protein Kow0040_13740 [Thermogutta sp.]